MSRKEIEVEKTINHLLKSLKNSKIKVLKIYNIQKN